MTGDLVKKMTISYNNTAQTQQNAEKPNAAQNPNKPEVQKSLEYSAAFPLSLPGTKPLGLIPHSPNGYLVSENVFQSMGSTVKSYGDYAKYFYNAGFKGEGTDYSVGKINDLAIRGGSLGIACVLAATKKFPMAKGMEFIGLGTWFASMAVWPKVMGAPIKALYGVDINQKYVDSYGRRKSFFEDPQYLPWDLYRHIDINKEYNKKASDYGYLNQVGDKLGIPRDIENRNEATQAKMKQIAIQSNTLWMLTAGVMTPVVSSIVADAIQKPLSDSLLKKKIKTEENEIQKLIESLGKVDKLLDNPATTAETIMKELGINSDEKFTQTINDFFEKKTITDNGIGEKNNLRADDFEKLKNHIMGRYPGSALSADIEHELTFIPENEQQTKFISVHRGLQKDLLEASKKATSEFKEDLFKENNKLIEDLEKFYKEQGLGKIADDTPMRDIANRFNENHNFQNKSLDTISKFEDKTFGQIKKALEKRDLTALGFEGFEKFTGLRIENIHEAVEEANYWKRDGLIKVGDKVLKDSLSSQIQIELENKIKNAPEVIEELSKKMVTAADPIIEKHRLYRINIPKIKQIINIAEIQMHLDAKVEKYAKATIKDISGSLTADNWSKFPQRYLKAMGFSQKDLDGMAKIDSTSASKIVVQRITALAKDPKAYDKAVKEMSECAKEILPGEFKAIQNLLNTYGKIKSVLNKIIKNGAPCERLRAGIDMAYDLMITQTKNKGANTINSLGRPIKALDACSTVDKFVETILGKDAAEYQGKLNDRTYQQYYIKNNSSLKKDVSRIEPFRGMSYKKAKEVLTEYLEHSIICNADINNATTRFESVPKGMSESFKNSESMNRAVYDFFYSPFNKNTTKNMPKELVKQMEHYSKEMAYIFSMTENKILHESQLKLFRTEVCEFLDKVKDISTLNKAEKDGLPGKLDYIESFIKDATKNEPWQDEMKKELGKIRTIIADGNVGNHNINNSKNLFNGNLFETANKHISPKQGKAVHQLFIDAAREQRSKNKWTKLVWGLFAGTTALSAVVIALMGRTNYFNRDVYALKGGNNANKQQ